MKIFQDTFYEIIFTQKNYFLHNKFKYIYIYIANILKIYLKSWERKIINLLKEKYSGVSPA